jgi:ABC-2 type transport system permease protein
MPLIALIQKEWRLLMRDWHAMLLLFAMPAAFILVMSLALQSRFALQQSVSVPYYLLNQDHSPASVALVTQLQTLPHFKILAPDAPLAELRTHVQRDRVQFLLVIPPGFGDALRSRTPVPLRLLAGPGVQPAMYALFTTTLHAALARFLIQESLAVMPLPASDSQGNAKLPFGPDASDRLLHVESLYTVNGRSLRPSSVQQSVPAWLLFAMFFIAVPLSTTWVQERQQGTYMRLQSMGASPRLLLAGKLLPYIGINLLQVVLMLCVGVFLVPWLGGERLTLGDAPLALTLVTLAVSFASVAYALLIANWVSTGEQAMIFTGIANLLMAAVGGVMVPSFIMPPMMQSLSHYSPMAWGLNGFLDIFLRQGGIGTVAPKVLYLLAFGISCLLLASLGLRKRRYR